MLSFFCHIAHNVKNKLNNFTKAKMQERLEEEDKL